MNARGLVIITIIALIMVSTSFLIVSAQPSEEEAKQKFEALGCTGCHNGGVAPTWEDVVNSIKEWKTKYGSLDEAVKNEVDFFGKKFNTYDEMIAEMAKSSAAGTPDNPDFQVIDQYLRSLFEGQATETGTTETTQTGTATGTTGTQTTQSPTETGTQTGTTETEEKGPVLGFGEIVAISAVILVIIVSLAWFIARR